MTLAEPASMTMERLVRHLAESDHSGEHGLWETADLIYEAISDQLSLTAVGRGEYKRSAADLLRPSFRNEAAREASRQIVYRLTEEGILIDGKEPSERSLLTWAETSYAWPKQERVEAASFYAHAELRFSAYDGIRHSQLARLAAKSPIGRATDRHVRNWKRDQRPAGQLSFLELVERRLRSAVKSAAAPWERTEEEDKLRIARILRQIAGEIETGEFH